VDFLERIFHISPDIGTGLTELSLLVVLAAVPLWYLFRKCSRQMQAYSHSLSAESKVSNTLPRCTAESRISTGLPKNGVISKVQCSREIDSLVASGGWAPGAAASRPQ
jgi:hypothetical protein